MVNNLLLGLIAVFMASIFGVGLRAVSDNPALIASTAVEAGRVVERVGNEAVSVVGKASKALGAPSGKADDSSRNDDRRHEDEDEDEREDDEDEDEDRQNSTPVISVPSAPSASAGSAGTGGTSNTSAAEKSFTMADIATHNSEASCYAAISGSVYDLTPFVSGHPGGVFRIVSICGKDGTSAFLDQHDGQRKPEQELAGLKIGVLVQ